MFIILWKGFMIQKRLTDLCSKMTIEWLTACLSGQRASVISFMDYGLLRICEQGLMWVFTWHWQTIRRILHFSHTKTRVWQCVCCTKSVYIDRPTKQKSSSIQWTKDFIQLHLTYFESTRTKSDQLDFFK